MPNWPIWDLSKETREIEFFNMFLNFLVRFWIYFEFLKFPWIWKIEFFKSKIVKKCQIGQFGSFDKNSKKFNFSTGFWIFWPIFEFILNFWNSHPFENLTISSLKLPKNAKNWPISNFGKLTKIGLLLLLIVEIFTELSKTIQ